MSWLWHPEVIALCIASLSFFAVLMLSFGAGAKYQIAYDRLPAATRLKELEVLVGGEEARLQEAREQLRRTEVSLSERDQAEAEAEFWRAAVQTAKAEHEALGEQRREIEQTREAHRQALEDLTIAETQLRDSRAAVEEARQKVELAEERLKSIVSEEDSFKNAQSELRGSVTALQNQLTELKAEKAELGPELERSRDRRSALQQECNDLEKTLERTKGDCAEATAGLENLRKALDGLSEKRTEIDQLQSNLSVLKAKHDALRQSIDDAQLHEGRLQARIARLNEDVRSASGADEPAEGKRALADLTKPPACLAIERDGQMAAVWPKQDPSDTEKGALDRVAKHLRECGLEFPARTINAFHTSLKTAVISPLTVLAGISGTGKSQLPRYYADAMGIHFLKIPVQPRWDSPQDLFGFYNYIEKRYKATNLARALVHLDPQNWPDEARNFEERMLLVLLDEMNLARVEYYFSEFLSRLEGRPLDESTLTEKERQPSEIDIDVAQGGQGKRVYVGQNILFAGTMNEDESTLALSDKVLDRANVLRFPKPVQLRESLPENSTKYAAQGFMPKARWLRKWSRKADDLAKGEREIATKTIAQINNVMNDLGRPFGHRMGQAILHYVANYPDGIGNNVQRINLALSDQIEQRILPRLRGVLVDDNGRALRDLADIAGRDLQDADLGGEIEQCISRSRETNGLFVWRGFMRRVK